MKPRHAPSITINGLELPDSWDGDGTAAFDTIKIQWGRGNIYDEPEPSKAQIVVLDPAGEWSTDYELYNAPVVIDRPGGRVFRGRVDTITITPDVRLNPNTGRPQEVWRTRITAIDPQAELAKEIPLGPQIPAGSGGTPVVTHGYLDEFGANYWGPTWIYNRLHDLRARLSHIIDGMYRFEDDTGAFYLTTISMGERVSALDHIRSLYVGKPLAHTNYNATTHMLELGFPADAPTQKLSYSSGMLSIVPTTGHAVSPSTVGLGNSPDVDVVPNHAIAAVDIEHTKFSIGPYRTYPEYPGQNLPLDIPRPDLTSAVVAPVPPHGGTNRLVIKLAAHRGDGSGAASSPWIPALATAIAEKVGRLNGQHYPPPLTFDLGRFDYGAALETLLLTLRDMPMPLTFLGSKFAGLARFGPAFQIIGGTLVYSGITGWQLEATLAPVISAAFGSLTVNQLVTNLTATLDSYADTITLTDLGNIAVGAS